MSNVKNMKKAQRGLSSSDRIERTRSELDKLSSRERDAKIAKMFDLAVNRKRRFIRDALEISVYKEDLIDEDGVTISRRPIVALENEMTRRSWLRRASMIENLFNELHEIAPERFPKKSALLNNKPLVVHNVISANIFTATAVDSRILTVDFAINLLKRSKQKISRLDSNLLVISKDMQIKLIDESIKYFKDNAHRALRVRTCGYTDVLTRVKTLNLPERPTENKINSAIVEYNKYRVGELGVFFVPAKQLHQTIDISVSQPDPNKPKESLYASIKPIEIPVPSNSLFYWEDEVEKYKKKMDGKFAKDQLPKKMPPVV